jgi:SAM-dependent methyltransferase
VGRQVWLAERRAALVADYDAGAASYGDDEYPWDMQQEWVARVLRLVGPGAMVLDAPCGTGKYFPMLAAAGVRVADADQSAGMLARARARASPSPSSAPRCRSCRMAAGSTRC